MDNVASQRLGIALAERLGPGGFDLAAGRLRQPPPEDVVLDDV